MIKYTLNIHSYEVLPNIQHSGFELKIESENGIITQTIDLIPDSNGNIKFKYDSYTPNDQTPYNGKTQLLTGGDALTAFNKLKLATSMLNMYTNSLDYNMLLQNCNSSSTLLAEKYIPGYANNGSSIFDNLPGFFVGDELNFLSYDPNFKKALDAVNKLINELGLDGIGLGNDLLNITKSDDYILVSVGDSAYKLDKEGILWEQNENGMFTTDLSNYCTFSTDPKPIMTAILPLFDTAVETRSPLVVDLDGDGVETVSENNGVYFDHDGNNFAEKTGWAGKDDGLLVRDINNNGKIDDGTELFGNNSVLSNGQKATNGFEALKDLDSNNDGKFNSSDTAWNEVKVWKDANQNGIVDNGEILSLEQANIKSIDLNYTETNTTDANGNIIGQIGSITKTDDTIKQIKDIWFDVDLSNTIDQSDVNVSEAIKALPDVQGFGNVHNIQIAMALDETGTLKTLVEQFVAETDVAARNNILLNIIYHWTGVQDVDPDSRNSIYVEGNILGDARKLEALEEFMGQEFLGTLCWGDRDPNPHSKAAPYILRAFDIIFDYVNHELLNQTHYTSLLENVNLTWNNQSQAWDVEVGGAVAQLQNIYAANPQNALAILKEFEKLVKNIGFEDSLKIYEAFRAHGSLLGNDLQIALSQFAQTLSTDNNDEIIGTDGIDEINGFAGDDRIYGKNGDDIILGGAGNDNIFGDNGNDILIGGAGNDYLVGGNGADTYLFDAGFGNDAIDNSDDDASATNPDIIRFGEGILASKTTLNRQGFDLIIRVSYAIAEGETTARPDDTICIYSYFDKVGTTSATVNSIIFADGTTWDYEYVLTHWNSIPNPNGGVTFEGGKGDDNLWNGTNFNDIMIGNEGNDILSAWGGNDILYGGLGNDTMHGHDGDDTYLWNWGDGLDTISDTNNHDKIIFGPGISFEDFKFRIDGYNLHITIKNDETQGLILDAFYFNSKHQIEDLQFYDGKVVHLSEIPLIFQQLDNDDNIKLTEHGDTAYGNGGNDVIAGGAGNDFIHGGKGNDYLQGQGGTDTYFWNLGDGLDTINTSLTTDNLVFGPGITFEDLTFRCEEHNLRIIVKGDETQGIINYEFFRGNNNQLVELIFHDGSRFPLQVSGLTLIQKDTDERIEGTLQDDIIYAGDGNDKIYGNQGNNTIIAGKGDDTIPYHNGNNTYVYNRGDGLDDIYIWTEDVVQFGEGISFSDLTFRRENQNFRIMINDSETQGMLCRAYNNPLGPIFKELRFADGSVVDFRNIGWKLNQTDAGEYTIGTNFDDIINGNGGDDIIEALDGNDIINGGTGNDTIRGGVGNDIITGGTGNDTLEGGIGSDTYIYNLGDGFDTIGDVGDVNVIKFGAGITFADLSFHNEGVNLVINIGNNADQGIVIREMMLQYGYHTVEHLQFADGTMVYLPDIDLIFNQSDNNETIQGTNYNNIINANGGDDIIYARGGNDVINGGAGNDTINAEYGDDILNGGDGNDTLKGDEGNDILNGGKGDDYLEGSWGDDTYIYNLGDGIDSILDYDGKDKISFGEGITLDDLTFEKNGNDLKVIVKNTPDQSINISHHFYSPQYQIEELEFADGSVHNINDIDLNLNSADNLIQAMSSFAATNASSMDINADPTSGMGEIYGITCSSDLSKKAA